MSDLDTTIDDDYPHITADAPEFGAIDDETTARLVPAVNALVALLNEGTIEQDDLSAAGGIALSWTVAAGLEADEPAQPDN